MAALATPTASGVTDKRFAPARLRRTVLEMAYAGSAVHIGCAFSIIEPNEFMLGSTTIPK